MEKTIRNIRTGFRTDGNYIDVFELGTSEQGRMTIVEAMQKCAELERLPWFRAIELNTWNTGIWLKGEEDYAIEGISVRSKSVVVTITARHNAEDFCESEELKMEDFFAEGERFLLHYGDDDEVHEFDPEEDDIEDFDVYRANSLEEAEEMCRKAVAEVRNADPAYYGEGWWSREEEEEEEEGEGDDEDEQSLFDRENEFPLEDYEI